jgi:HAE1 family hydrophobic/amphiphilic exporter-1
MTITEIAIKRPILVIVLFSTLGILGIFGYSQLKYELLPNIDTPTVSVNTTYTGASANVVETSVTRIIENAISGVDGIDTITSTSQQGSSRVRIEFVPEVNIDYALQDVQRKVNQVLSRLPDEATSPAVTRFSFDDIPIMTIGLTSNLPDTKFYQMVNDLIAPNLSTVSGVGQVTIQGGRQRQIQVNLDAGKLQAYGISPAQALSAIKKTNLEYPTGLVKDSDKQYIVRLAGRFQSIDQIRNLVISHTPDGANIRIADVGEVVDGKAEISSIVRINGRNTIALVVQRQSDANAVETSQNVRKALVKLEQRYKRFDLKSTIATDTSTYIMDSANAVKKDLLLAILLVAGVMLVFLHSFRNSIIVMIAIPTSLVTTFIGMWAFKFSLNVITLLALSLVIGILVDDAIVVLENIYRHLEMGKKKQDAALEGRNEIGFTALSITMVDVVVYLPLTLVTGIIGGMIKEFSIVVVISTLMSLFVSFTVTPMLASRFGKLERLTKDTLMGRFGLWFERLYDGLIEDYKKLLRVSLAHPWVVLAVTFGLFIATVSLIPLGFIGQEFMPQADQSQLQINLDFPAGTKIDQNNAVTQRIENLIAAIPEVKIISSSVGSSGWTFGQSSSSTLTVTLLPRDQRKRSTEEVGGEIRKKLGRISGVKAYISQPGLFGGGNSSAIQVAVNGPSWESVSTAADQVKEIMARIPGTSDIRLSSVASQPEVNIQLDNEKMASLGVDVETVGNTLETGLSGNTDSKYKDTDGTEYDIQVMLDKFDRTRTADVGNLTVLNRSGQLVALNQFANITRTFGPTRLERRDRSYSITVRANAIGRTSGDIGIDLQKALDEATLPYGVTTSFTGNLKNQAKAFSSLGLALLAAVIFVYLIMAALYNSFVYPFAVLFSIPMAVIGALLALGLANQSLAVFSIMGIIMQVGLVSKNAILLVDFANRAREDGKSIHEALMEAGQERLRPILMTTLTMILGMLPLALAKSAGAEFKNGLGFALIGGLSCSMLMTLVVVPVVYTKVAQIQQFILKIGGKIWKRNQSI